MFQYVLFDLDGTLTEPKEGITKSVQYALKAFGIEENDLDHLECFIGPPLSDSFMENYGFTREETKDVIKVYRERFQTIGIFENRVYDGIEEMLSTCKEKGMILAIASSKPTVFVERILEHFHLRQYFDVLVGAFLDGTREKKEEVVKEALRQLAVFTGKIDETQENVSKEELCGIFHKGNCAMVGDRKFDVQGAKEYNVFSMAVRYGYAKGTELEDEGADRIVETPEELCEALCAGGSDGR